MGCGFSLAAKERLYTETSGIDDGVTGPGYCHFPMERDEEYFRQLTGEKIVTKYSQGRAKRTWIKTRARNEALDVRVYALGAFSLLNTNINPVAQRIEKTRESYPIKSVLEPVMRRPGPRRNSGGFVNSWRG